MKEGKTKHGDSITSERLAGVSRPIGMKYLQRFGVGSATTVTRRCELEGTRISPSLPSLALAGENEEQTEQRMTPVRLRDTGPRREGDVLECNII